MGEILIASVVSLQKPLPGQSARSSENFSTENAPSNTTRFRVVVESSLDVNSVPTIIFNIAEDRSGSDSVIYSDVRNGYTLSVQRKEKLYIIARQSTTTKPFKVNVYAIT
ncbi:hypothetical protein [Bacillus mycoides]|uniref:hypothetical protein n=1 Tax=Bacillus mycoides TaxID=1405 RepID=UPI0002799867|nr:hypothetical protein [Bacillus mycoides]EJR95829.1 hypothetical protein IKM_05466 [Bacillus mycoides]